MKALREHGTRAMYVGEKCRCTKCREANRVYYHSRKNRSIALAAKVVTETKKWAPQTWTTVDGFKEVRFYKQACPGLTKRGCPTRSHLRKDSKAGICGNCRDHIITTHTLHSSKECLEHLDALSKAGVGVGAVRKATGLSKSALQELRRGKKWVTPETERKILSVRPTALAEGSRVDATESWQIVKELLKRHQMTRGEISKELGNNGRSLQMGKKFIRLSTAKKLKELVEHMRSLVSIEDICTQCGASHLPAVRLARLRASLPISGRTIREKWPCIYPGGDATDAMVYRDLIAIGAVRRIGKKGDPNAVYGIPPAGTAKPTHTVGEGLVEGFFAPPP
jgi:hypothetical protein